MSKLYVSSFEDNGVIKYGIYNSQYESFHQECFKPVIFDSVEEAQAKLSAYEEERVREESAVPFTLEEAEKYAESHYWKYASSYAKTAPHEYCVKSWLVEKDKLLYERFVATIRTNSVVGYFYGHKNDYLILGKHYYWFMPGPDNYPVDLINRTTTDYLEYRDDAYHYKDRTTK